ncbi:conserved hypothetical protein [Leptospira interrogans serovar Manilae]|uniref:Uncharacterized protein n=1 Tax=Leptospira interrogans serovar Manilae TaxID=214675 RepID=A0AAQ1SP12_LEPIR|nr:conserved hypothetical protein [Leptospira interrogans serovar Manilae]
MKYKRMRIHFSKTLLLMCKLLDSMFYYIVIVANDIRLITVITRIHKNNIYAELVLKLKMRIFFKRPTNSD